MYVCMCVCVLLVCCSCIKMNTKVMLHVLTVACLIIAPHPLSCHPALPCPPPAKKRVWQLNEASFLLSSKYTDVPHPVARSGSLNTNTLTLKPASFYCTREPETSPKFNSSYKLLSGTQPFDTQVWKAQLQMPVFCGVGNGVNRQSINRSINQSGRAVWPSVGAT